MKYVFGDLPKGWRLPAALVLTLAAVLFFLADYFILPRNMALFMPYFLLVILMTIFVGNGLGLVLSILAIGFWSLASTRMFAEVSDDFWPNFVVNTVFVLIEYAVLFRFRQLHAQVRDLSVHDALTGLYNRRGFLLLAEQLLLVNRRRGVETAVVYIDVDNFKSVNDTWGHKEGDRVIATLGRILSDAVRESDIAARLGGDEFCIAFSGTPDETDSLVGRIHGAFLEQANISRWGTTLSVGIVFGADELSVEELLAQSDKRMYETKKRSKNALRV